MIQMSAFEPSNETLQKRTQLEAGFSTILMMVALREVKREAFGQLNSIP
jgi:hypothetical protein